MPRILVVDDDPSVGLTFKRMLESAGHTVVLAESAKDGLTTLVSDRPDAVILDMRMPVMSGLEFLRRLKAMPGLQDVPTGIVTGDYFLNEQVLTELGQLGVEVRYKPVWMDDLLAFAGSLLAEQENPS